MNPRPSTVLIVGATGSIGRPAAAEALRQGHAVRALVRDQTRAARVLPDSVDLVIGDLNRPETLGPALDGVGAIVFTHGSTTTERDVRDNDYAGVANVLKTLDGSRPVHIALMTAIGTTRPGVAYAQWKLRSERLVRASGNPYTIVRPGWFDNNLPDQRKIVMLQATNDSPAHPKTALSPGTKSPASSSTAFISVPPTTKPSSSSPTMDPNKTTSPPSSPHSRRTQANPSTLPKTLPTSPSTKSPKPSVATSQPSQQQGPKTD
ncbi:SDR family oxidoreductase [Arthrobacter sp. AFG20]|uniref:SDR family oxidoreductase n=1 Tax=Arthrobacter sp. AFG20 TaxID=1688671 RepID=UPI001CA4FA75|nr:SDR family oxidoreductase [Arthrobacter sp. AFG20]